MPRVSLKGAEQLELEFSYVAAEDAKLYNSFEKTIWHFLQSKMYAYQMTQEPHS